MAPSPNTQEKDANASVQPLSYSEPVSIRIPAIEVTSSIIKLGKNADGTVAVPSGENFNKAAWYKHSPTPGQFGASIIEGHVDYVDKGPAIFFRLAELRLNDRIYVQRADGKTVEFKVNKVQTYMKEDFPTKEVYKVTDGVALRLITCGGDFNGQSGEYDSNTIVFADIVSTS